MSNKLLSLTLALSLGLSTLSASADVHWSYDGKKDGATQWGTLTDTFEACSEGLNQSPINLSSFIEAELPAIKFTYALKSNEILNNGHTVQVNIDAGSSISVDGIDFEVKQVHFHTPSENNINGKSFPLEAHFVHASKEGKLAVIAVMFEEGAENKALQGFWDNMPMNAGDKTALIQDNIAMLLPTDRDYYRFNGSLTTPPCSEGVRWLVMKKSITLSKAQIATFQKVMKTPNNRPLQGSNARMILQ
jgi:carbonic anhydrase